jgi:hypothetical protein
MIHYQLRCSRDHEFDGWFKDSAAFEQQAELKLVECPVCGDRAVDRALMAPALASVRGQAMPAPGAQQDPPRMSPAPVTQGGPLPDQMRAVLQRLRTEVEKNCDYVGSDFADEARRMHRGDSDRRAIYGETTPDEAQSLTDEGINFSRIPWVSRAES